MERNKSILQKEEFDDEKWVSDSSLDHKSRVPLRASTGVWRASLFIIGKDSLATYIHIYIQMTKLRIHNFHHFKFTSFINSPPNSKPIA